MTYDELVVLLEEAWSPEGGFLWRVREGHFDSRGGNDLLSQLARGPAASESPIPSRLVSLVWYVPIFLTWNRCRVVEACPDAESDYDRFVERTTHEIERILGVP